MPAGRAGSREDVFGPFPCQLQVESIGTQVDITWPFELSMRTELDLGEHAFLLPRHKHAPACEVG